MEKYFQILLIFLNSNTAIMFHMVMIFFAILRLINISLVFGELSKRFQRFSNYAIANYSNFTSPCSSEEACINTCLNDAVCTAISMDNGSPGRCKSGKINQYGRVFIVPQVGWTTWMRRMPTFILPI